MRARTVEAHFLRFRESGDPRALAAVFDATARELLRLARHLAPAGSEPEDLLQATFLTAMQSAATFEPDRPLRPWLSGILANHAHKAVRERRAAAPKPRAVADADPVRSAEATELRDALTKELATVAEPYRAVLALYLQHGLTPKEIAESLGRSRPTVRSQLHRGLELLRRCLPAGLTAAVVVGTPSRGLAAVRRAVLAGGPRTSVVATIVAAVGSALSLKKTQVAIGAVALIVASGWWLGQWSWPEPRPNTEASEAPASVTAALPEAVDQPVARTVLAKPSVDEPAAVDGALVVTVVAPSGAPVADRWVGVLRPDRPRGIRYFPVREGRTDQAGRVELGPLPGAVYEIRALAVDARPRVQVRAGERVEHVLTTDSGVAVDGRVVDPMGHPVPHAQLYVETGRTEHTRPLASADAFGQFAVASFPAGYRLGALADGFAPSHRHTVRGGSDGRESLTIVMTRPAATLRGVVVDARGDPIARAFVAIQPKDLGRDYRDPQGRKWSPPEVQVLRADELGQFVCHQAPAEPVLIVGGAVDRADELPAVVEADLAPGEEQFVRLQTTVGATVAGTVSRAGVPVAGVEVVVIPLERANRRDAFELIGQFESGDARSGANGEYLIRGVKPGRYRLYARGMSGDTPEELVIDSVDSIHRDIRLVPHQPLSLRVVDSTGQPLEGWQVTVHYRTVWPSATTDSDGRVRFEDFDAGDYTALIEAPSDRAATHHVFAALGIEDLASGSTPHTVVVPDAKLPTARVRVRIRDDEGRVPASAELSLRSLVIGRAGHGYVAADELGLAETGILPPGSYTLTVRARDHRPLRLGERTLAPNEVLDLGEVVLK